MNAFRAALLFLLAANTIYFVVAETPSKGMDALAWLTLLVLFQAETSFAGRFESGGKRLWLRALRLVAAIGVLASTIGYFFEQNALDAANATLWLLVVALLEAELRWPAHVRRHAPAFKTATAATFGGLGLVVVLWVVSGLWFDAYDAVLWLVAFVALERDITRQQPAAARARQAG